MNVLSDYCKWSFKATLNLYLNITRYNNVATLFIKTYFTFVLYRKISMLTLYMHVELTLIHSLIIHYQIKDTYTKHFGQPHLYRLNLRYVWEHRTNNYQPIYLHRSSSCICHNAIKSINVLNQTLENLITGIYSNGNVNTCIFIPLVRTG